MLPRVSWRLSRVCQHLTSRENSHVLKRSSLSTNFVMMSSSTNATEVLRLLKVGDMPDWTWQQTMIRVKDKNKSLAFYRDILGLTLIDKYDFPKGNFSLLFLASLPPGTNYELEPGSPEAHRFLWSTRSVCIELTHNWGTEKNENFKYHPGNQDKDGFGHLAFAVDDVYAACEKLMHQGVGFKKKPGEGNMKDIAFAYDPDGYYVEIVQRKHPGNLRLPYFQFAQTMLRVKDPAKSLPFYKRLGMTLVSERHFDNFSLYFLASLPLGIQAPDPKSLEAQNFVKESLYPASIPILELTHNHGTEKDETFRHFNGNVEPRRGFGHIGFLVDDVYKRCEELENEGIKFQKKPDEGNMKGLAFVLDPDGYWVEIIKRGQEGSY